MPQIYDDPYATLGLERGADSAAIKQAYFTLVRAHAPEREPEMFKRIRAAYERLRDEDKRVETDMRLLRRWNSPAKPRRLPPLLLVTMPEDVVEAARSLTDLARTDWRGQHHPVLLDR